MMSPKKPEVMFDVMPATGRAGLWDATPFSVALNDRATFLCAGEGIDLGELLVLLVVSHISPTVVPHTMEGRT